MLLQALRATLPTLESMPPMAMADETKSSSCRQSFWLPRSVQPSSAQIHTHSGQAVQPPESIAQTPHVGTSSFAFLGSATLAQNQALQARREKLLLRKTRALPGFRLIPCLRPEPERLPDHKAGQRGRPRTYGGHHEQFRTSGEGSQGSRPLHRAQGLRSSRDRLDFPPREPRSI